MPHGRRGGEAGGRPEVGRRRPAGLEGAGWTRGAWWAAVLLLAACGRPDTPEGLARRFMEDYYVRADLGNARGLAAGLASKKIDEQMDLTRGQAVGGATEGRDVAYSLVSRQDEGDQHRFLYEVRIRLKGGGEFTRRSIVSVGRVEGAWRVTNFHEAGS